MRWLRHKRPHPVNFPLSARAELVIVLGQVWGPTRGLVSGMWAWASRAFGLTLSA